MRKPRCCEKAMLRASSRVRKPGDPRPTSKTPYAPIGWYCPICGDIRSLKVDINGPSLLLHRTKHENTVLHLTVQHKVEGQNHIS